MYTDFNYYKDIYKGTLINDEIIYNRHGNVAYNVINNHTFGNIGDITTQSESDQELIKNTECLFTEMEYNSAQNLVSGSTGEVASVSETVGSYKKSTSYQKSSTGTSNSSIQFNYINDKFPVHLRYRGLDCVKCIECL